LALAVILSACLVMADKSVVDTKLQKFKIGDFGVPKKTFSETLLNHNQAPLM